MKLYTRREMTRLASICVAGIVSGGLAFSQRMRNSLALKGAMFEWKRGGAWSNPYITDGLVAMWDGEWNADGGKHDAAQDSLVDLSGGGHDMTFVGTHQLNAKSVTIDGVSGAYGTINGLEWGPQSTMEFVLSVSSKNHYGRIIGENRGLCVTDWAGGFMHGYCYGYGTDGVIGSTTETVYNSIHSVGLAFSWPNLYYHVDGTTRGTRTTSFTGKYSGQTTFFNRTSGSRGVSGELYSARIYSRALTQSEIAANYAVDADRFGAA